MTIKRKSSSTVVATLKEKSGSAGSWVIHKGDGTVKKVSVKKSSAETMDKIARKYAGAMKRLAVR